MINDLDKGLIGNITYEIFKFEKYNIRSNELKDSEASEKVFNIIKDTINRNMIIKENNNMNR